MALPELVVEGVAAGVELVAGAGWAAMLMNYSGGRGRDTAVATMLRQTIERVAQGF